MAAASTSRAGELALRAVQVNWIAKSDDEIIAATMKELERLFPLEIAADGSKAQLNKCAAGGSVQVAAA